MIELTCWGCGLEGRVRAHYTGMKVACKRCRCLVRVPDSVTDEIDVTAWLPAIDPSSEAVTREVDLAALSGFHYVMKPRPLAV
jgi:hypothetical protein